MGYSLRVIRRAATLLALAALSSACRRHRHRPPVVAAAPVQAGVAAEEPAEEPVVLAPEELLPGPLTAFGLVLPLGSHLTLEGDGARMFHVDASMPQVMRYMQRRLTFHDADILPLGAMIRSAHLAEPEAEVTTLVDVGVRDEGLRTFVTVWNRTVPARPPQSMAEGLRASGIDPTTGAPLQNN